MFFQLSSWVLALILFAVVLGATAAGLAVGHSMRMHAAKLSEPFAVLQGALLGVVGLILAFGLALAVGRYEDRRAALVAEANAIGTTYLRAQTLGEPERTRSMDRLAALHRHRHPAHRFRPRARLSLARRWPTGTSSSASCGASPGTRSSRRRSRARRGCTSRASTRRSTSRAVRVAGLKNRVPAAVLALEVLGAVVALALLAAYLAVLGRGRVGVFMAASLVALLLLVTFDLDRPTRGMITVPDAPLVELRASMALPPASSPSLADGGQAP